MKSLPTGTVTFLFTDIEGSTTLLQQLGDHRYAKVLEEHRRLLRAVFAEGGGQEVDTQGDAFLVAFSRARDAVASAVAALQSVLKHNWPDGVSLRVRMGLHTGEPVSEAGGYVGLDVHRAARICSAGQGHQILLSQVVEILAAHDLPQGVSLRDLGSHRLKDLREAEHLFQVVHPDLPADFSPLKSLDVLPNNLPIQLTSFIGREREIGEAKGLLSKARLLTITGAGGVGKTRLALQLAAEVLEEFKDGVWLVELASLPDPALVPNVVASALKVPEQPNRSFIETLVNALRSKSLLLVIDNCEHLVSACASLADTLLRACPRVRILATSREALGNAGELTYRVPSLSIPDILPRLPTAHQLLGYDAIRLFAERASFSDPRFEVTSNNAVAVAQICSRLDGIPLAIELAAARVKVLAVEQIARRLDDRFPLLTTGSRPAIPRHQTLRAAFDWSYSLLSEAERLLLARLSVFASGWTLEAAEAICAGDGVNASEMLSLLGQLVDKSLVLMETHRGEARYRLLETVRQYSRDKFRADEEADVRRRHLHWYMVLAERAEPYLTGQEQENWFNLLEMEHDNFRAALEWSRKDHSSREGAFRVAAALERFWRVRGYFGEGRAWLESLLANGNGISALVRARALTAAGALAEYRGDFQQATALCREGLVLFQQLDDRLNMAHALLHLGIVEEYQGNHAQAVVLFEESLAYYREVGNKWGIGVVVNNLGEVARAQGDYARAEVFYAESLELHKVVGDKRGIGISFANLGYLALRQGDNKRAAELLNESLRLYWELGYRYGSAVALAGLGAVAITHGYLDRATRLLGFVAALLDALGSFLEGPDRAEYEAGVTTVRDALDGASFAAAWAEGRAMTLEQAIEYALAVETK